MNELNTPTLFLIGLPAALFLFFGFAWLAGFKHNERVLSRTTIAVHVLLTGAVAWLAFQLEWYGRPSIFVDTGTWFAFEEVQVHFSFLLDRLSLTMAALTVVLVGGYLIAGSGSSALTSTSTWILGFVSVTACCTALFASVRTFVDRKPRHVVNLVLVSVVSMAVAGLTSVEPKGIIGGLLVAIMFVIAAIGIHTVLRGLEARTELAVDPHDNLGLGQKAPRLSFFFLVFCLALVGIPGTLGFVAEDLLFHGALHTHPFIGIALPLATALNAIHLLRNWHLLFIGRLAKDVANIPDALPRERWPLMACMLPLIVLGTLPQLAIAWSAPAAEWLGTFFPTSIH